MMRDSLEIAGSLMLALCALLAAAWFFTRRSAAPNAGKKSAPCKPAYVQPAPPESGPQIVDVQHLALFTRGDSGEERMMANIFVASGVETLETLRRHLRNEATGEDWQNAAQKLKGSAGRIGATQLASACMNAEGAATADAEMKENLLRDIEHNFARVQYFFSDRLQ